MIDFITAGGTVVGHMLINGGKSLYGTINIQGSKNSALPIMAAAILVPGVTVIKNCPVISDVIKMQNLLEEAGCVTAFADNIMTIDATNVNNPQLNSDTASHFRGSVLLLGALVGRLGKAVIAKPGGCRIGKRPIDLHIYAFEKLGINCDTTGEFIKLSCSRIKSGNIEFTNKSVGATENAVIAAVCGDGDTLISNSAVEPEIIELCDFLNACGANIVIDENTITVGGNSSLIGTSHNLEPDRIVLGTYMLGCVMTGGKVEFANCELRHTTGFLDVVTALGGKVSNEDGVEVYSEGNIQSINYIETDSYPGFPTDLQPQTIAALAYANGKSIVYEKIFENRFAVTAELEKMGAALVNAGLRARGMTVIEDEYINRGYEDICRDYNLLGADIEWIKERKKG